MTERTIYQPIQQEIREKLDPEYVAFHDERLQYVVPSEQTPWNASLRIPSSSSPFAGTELQGVEVDSVQDVFLRHSELRIFTPRGSRPAHGWPVFLWFHGGGWTLGNINSDNAYCSHVAAGASCISINVNYRHAPEDPFPAAVDDVFEALKWVASSESSAYNIDSTRIVIGGTSAGGNLAAVLSLKAALSIPKIDILGQLLLLPVIDNTAIANSPIWSQNSHSPWLTPSRMLWYRAKYLPNKEDCLEWTASPNLAPQKLLQKSPRTWIAVSECDLLAPEGLAYGHQLKEADVKVETKTYLGSTHSLLAASGKKLVSDSIVVLNDVLDTAGTARWKTTGEVDVS